MYPANGLTCSTAKSTNTNPRPDRPTWPATPAGFCYLVFSAQVRLPQPVVTNPQPNPTPKQPLWECDLFSSNPIQ